MFRNREYDDYGNRNRYGRNRYGRNQYGSYSGDYGRNQYGGYSGSYGRNQYGYGGSYGGYGVDYGGQYSYDNQFCGSFFDRIGALMLRHREKKEAKKKRQKIRSIIQFDPGSSGFRDTLPYGIYININNAGDAIQFDSADRSAAVQGEIAPRVEDTSEPCQPA